MLCGGPEVAEPYRFEKAADDCVRFGLKSSRKQHRDESPSIASAHAGIRLIALPPLKSERFQHNQKPLARNAWRWADGRADEL